MVNANATLSLLLNLHGKLRASSSQGLSALASPLTTPGFLLKRVARISRARSAALAGAIAQAPQTLRAGSALPAHEIRGSIYLLDSRLGVYGLARLV